MFSSESWLASTGGFYNGVATQSLRFDDGSSSFITREFVTPTNLNKWTINLWVKRGNISTLQEIIGSDYIDITLFALRFLANNTLEFLQYSAGGGTIICDLITTQVFYKQPVFYCKNNYVITNTCFVIETNKVFYCKKHDLYKQITISTEISFKTLKNTTLPKEVSSFV